MYSVVDIAGLNPLSRRILGNAAGAIAGMVAKAGRPTNRPTRAPPPRRHDVRRDHTCRDRSARAPGAHRVRGACLPRDGRGGRAMEGLIDDGYVAGVVDVTTTEWCDEVVGGVLSAGPDRLGGRTGGDPAGRLGRRARHGELRRHRDRARALSHADAYKHNDAVTLMRTTADECVTIGRCIAGQLNRAKKPTVVVPPCAASARSTRKGSPFTILTRIVHCSKHFGRVCHQRFGSSSSMRTSTIRRLRKP